MKVKTKKNEQPPAPEGFLVRAVARVPYRTGFCTNGQHEGTRMLSQKGSLLRPCRGTFTVQGRIYECKCECHEVFRQIAELTGVRAAESQVGLIGAFIDTEESAPSTPPGDARNPEDTPVTAATGHGMPTVPGEPVGVSSLQSLLTQPGLMVPSVSVSQTMKPYRLTQTFQPTASGQRARGQLESEVAVVVTRWFGGTADGPAPIALTPDSVRVAIRTEPPASNGAIYACFKRWEKQGWVVLADKPFRMLSLTESGARQISRL